MEARSFGPGWGIVRMVWWLCLVVSALPAWGQAGRHNKYAAHSTNFVVFASSPEWAAQVAEMAELNRRQLAEHWLGRELPAWSERVPIHVEAAPNLGAGGETRFALLGGNRIGQWMMSVSGTQERILDSVLPHEITHTILATHFAPLGKYVPRWADEGACTTVEHISEKQKHQHHLKLFLQTGRGLAFNHMFQLKEYPSDIMPLYAQGHSAVQFLIDQGGPQKFIKFLEAGMRSESWNAALEEFYAYQSIGQFQTLWNQWLADGSPENLLAYSPALQRDQSGATGQPTASAGAVALVSSQSTPPALTQSPPLQAEQGVQLASNTLAADRAQLPPLGNESWYKRRLREVAAGELPRSAPPQPTAVAAAPISSPGTPQPVAATFSASPDLVQPPSAPSQSAPPSSAPPVPSLQLAAAPTATSSLGLRPQAVGRGQGPQSPGIQVLDWGDSVPVRGIQSGLRPTH